MTIANQSAPLLSVITPCRDAARTLADTLASVAAVATLLERSGHHLEHLIVDGNSQDGTSQLVASHCKRYPWCGWRPGYPGGPYLAMNVGLAKARGHYVHILNADDLIINPVHYVSALLAAKNLNANYILSSIVYLKRPAFLFQSQWLVEAIPTQVDRWRSQLRAGLHFPHPGFIATRKLYAKQGFDLSYLYAADYKTMQALLLSAHPNEIFVVQQTLVAMDQGGITSTWRGRYAGARELQAINRELGIHAPQWRRYIGKIIQRSSANLF